MNSDVLLAVVLVALALVLVGCNSVGSTYGNGIGGGLCGVALVGAGTHSCSVTVN